MTIEHISDTALWVAYYRAMESARPDAVFHDPFAGRLAGERGKAIVDAMPRGRAWAWPMIVRTAVMDELVLRTIAGGVDTVVNLAAGLDARAWRMDLPSSLRWFDVDLPAILQYKLDILQKETPVCRYEAIVQDLRDRAARQELFARIGAESKATAVLTEGLLVYLEREEAAALATDLHAVTPFRWWIIDIAGPRVLKYMQRGWAKQMSADAEFKFAPAEGTGFYDALGWREAEFRSTGEEGQRLGREMSLAWLWRLLGRLQSEARREEIRRMGGVVLFDRK